MNTVISLRRLVPAIRPDFRSVGRLAALAPLTIALAISTAAPLAHATVTTSTTTTTTSTEPDPTTTTSTTMIIKGACCAGTGCYNEGEDYCVGELQGTYIGDATSCDDPGVCVNCGDGCKQYGETCDDGNTANGDGCDEKCGEEACYKCTVLLGDSRNVVVPFCFGPSTCFFDEKCGFCGDGTTGPGEECDDGNTAGGDCCDEACLYEEAGSDCADGIFCDGAESCDGSGSCVEPGSGPDCSALDAECALGVCDPETDACVADTEAKNDDECANSGSCTVDGSGECLDGECVGDGTTLSPSCRWIVCAGSPDGDVRVHTGEGSSLNANACGDTAVWGGLTSASVVAAAATGEGVWFYDQPEVAGDIVTGGSTIGSSLYVEVPGTDLDDVATGLTVPKLPSGQVNTTGLHALVDVCDDDQAALDAAVPVLDGMGNPAVEEGGPGGLRLAGGGSHTIDVTGDGLAVVDMDGLKLGKDSTLTLKGGATDVVMLRINGPMKLGYGADLVLDGLVPSNVVLYGKGSRCRMSPGSTGAGTVFCPEAGRFVVGYGVIWSGTFLGGAREVRVRVNAQLTHVAFTGF